MAAGEAFDPAAAARRLAGAEPAGLPQYLLEAGAGRSTFPGTGVRPIVTSFAERPSGLLIPAAANAAPVPLDLIRIYVTLEELAGISPDLNEVRAALAERPVERILLLVAHAMNLSRRYGGHQDATEALLPLVDERIRAKLANLLRDPRRVLLSPQALFALAKLACAVSPDGFSEAESADLTLMFAMNGLLGVQGDLGPNDLTISGAPGPFGQELVANQIFNTTKHPINVIGRFMRRWVQLPVEMAGSTQMEPLAQRFKDATDVELDDFVAVGLALWAVSVNGSYLFEAAFFDPLGWEPERLAKVLELISVDVAKLRAAVEVDSAEFGLAWSIAPFERWPVIRLDDGRLLLIDPNLLVRRVFGWLPLFDILDGLKRKGASSRERDKVRAALNRVTEAYVLETLRRVVDGGAGSGRVYDDEALEQAYARAGRQKADAVIDYGDAFVVVEVTTSQPTRATVSGTSEDAVMADIAKLVHEAGQVDATIAALRENPTILTGHQHGRPRFFPVLVCTEGFPVNPVTITLLREAIAAAGVLRGSDTAEVEVLDLEEVEMLDSLVDGPRLSLREILAGKQASSMERGAVRDYLLMTASGSIRPSRALHRWVEGVMEPVIDRLKVSESLP